MTSNSDHKNWSIEKGDYVRKGLSKQDRLHRQKTKTPIMVLIIILIIMVMVLGLILFTLLVFFESFLPIKNIVDKKLVAEIRLMKKKIL